MLKDSPVFPTLPSTDIQRSKKFYQDKLGLEIIYEDEGSVLFQAGKGSRIYLYKRPTSNAEHTLASFYVDDIYKAVEQLSENGVNFEHYDMNDIKTDKNGVAAKGDQKAAWFKDPDGNILGLSQVE